MTAGDDEHEWVGVVYRRLLELSSPRAELSHPRSLATMRRALDAVRRHRAPEDATAEELWDLYALHRIDALLRTAFQVPRPPDRAAVSDLRVAEYTDYWTSLGFDVVTAARFHPFFHEIVEVEAADDPDAAATLVGTVWPCLCWGRLLFTRAGVRIRAGARVIDGDLACRSRLYWSHRRIDRPCEDLSTGWGSNSQWRTAFRRDYVDGERLRYNIDAPGTPSDGDAVPVHRQAELLRYRCCVTPPLLDDLWPWDLTADEPVPDDLGLVGLTGA